MLRFLGWIGFLSLLLMMIYSAYTYVGDRMQIAREVREQCGQYDRQNRKHCLIIRQVL